MAKEWQVFNEGGQWRVVVTKMLPGERWLEILTAAGCQVEVCTSEEILSVEEIEAAIGKRCDGAIGQLTEAWGERLFSALKRAGGTVYSNYAVGYNNVDVGAARKHGILVGNTPGVLTETTAEMAVALTLAAARRVVEADNYVRAGKFDGWLLTLFLGKLMKGGTVGVIGAGRIGTAYARMMVEGFKMNLVYFNPSRNAGLEEWAAAYGDFLESRGEERVWCRRLDSVEGVLETADVVSLHPPLIDETRHLIDAGRLALMKADAILVNTSRGPVIDEAALVDHCRVNPEFRAGLDVFEDEPALAPGLSELDNVVIVPHIGSATGWTREGMAILAACNVVGVLNGYPLWDGDDVTVFLGERSPRAVPSIVNVAALGSIS